MLNDSSKSHAQKNVAEKWLTAFQVFLLGLLLYLGPPTIAATLLYIGTQLFGMSDVAANNWLQHITLGQFMYIALTETIVMVTLWFLIKHAKLQWSDIGVRKPKFSHIQYVLLGVAAYFALYVAVASLAAIVTNIDLDQQQEIGFNTNISGLNLVLAAISLIVLPPVVEEILFRGYLYNRLRQAFSVFGAGLLVSLLFGAAHLQLDTGNVPLYIAAIDTFVLSVVLVYVREKTGTIWAGVCIHALKNAMAFIILFHIFS